MTILFYLKSHDLSTPGTIVQAKPKFKKERKKERKISEVYKEYLELREADEEAVTLLAMLDDLFDFDD